MLLHAQKCIHLNVCLMCFDRCIHLCNHHHYQDTEHFCHLQKSSSHTKQFKIQLEFRGVTSQIFSFNCIPLATFSLQVFQTFCIQQILA